MRFSLAVFLSVLVFSPTPVGASQSTSPTAPDITTTQGFLEICATVDKTTGLNSQEYVHKGSCLGWVTGFIDGVQYAETAHAVAPEEQLFCPPSGVTYLQAVHVIRKFIADHPEDEHLSIRVITLKAMPEESR